MKIKFVRSKFKGEIAHLKPFYIEGQGLFLYFRFKDSEKNFMQKFDLESFLCVEKGDYELCES